MTVDSERLRSINCVREFLESLLQGKHPRVTKRRVLELLHHYPEQYWTEMLQKGLEEKGVSEFWELFGVDKKKRGK